MKRLKIKLSYSILFLFCLIIIFQFQNNKNKTKYNIKEEQFKIKVIDYKTDGDMLTLEARGKEKIMIYYYFKAKKEKKNFISKIKIGDTLKIKGKLKQPTGRQNLYGFDYRNYLLSKNIKWVLNADSILYYKHNSSIFYKIKNEIIKRLKKINNQYLELFILGKNTLDNDIKSTYSKNGISHLFAISGMHISLLVLLLDNILKIFIKKKTIINLILSSFLFLFMFLTNFTPSVLRAGFMYILSNLFPKINNLLILIIIGLFLLIINPYYIYNLGFIFSFIISFCLIYFNNKNIEKNYFKNLFQTSSIAFLVSIPILIYNFHEINFLSIFWNLIFVPFVSLILFPFGIITFLFPIFVPLFNFLTRILETVSTFASKINIFTLTFRHLNIIIIFCYYIIIWLIFKINKKYSIILILLLIIHFNINTLDSNLTISIINIGQGDSILIKFPHNKGNLLLDTGGKVEFEKDKWQIQKNKTNLAINTIIPYLKAEGIKKLDYLILTHGDFDHMGEAVNLVNNFKVNKVVFNCGEYNNLENQLIKILNNKKIPNYSCLKQLNINNNKLYFLNTKEYDNENDNSNVIYTKFNNYKFLFMGDAGIDKEKDILEKYNINNIDVLKVGHHGSDTSSDKEFIKIINPKYSLISVGKNNRYGHPKNSVLDTLSDSKIYRTDLDGGIEMKLNKNGYKIRTCRL